MMTAHAKKETERAVKLQFTIELEMRTQRCFETMVGSVAFGQSPQHAAVVLSTHCASLDFCACSMAANVDKIAKNLLFTRNFNNNNSQNTDYIQYWKCGQYFANGASLQINKKVSTKPKQWPKRKMQNEMRDVQKNFSYIQNLSSKNNCVYWRNTDYIVKLNLVFSNNITQPNAQKSKKIN